MASSSYELDSPVSSPKSKTLKRLSRQRSGIVMLEGYMDSPDTIDSKSNGDDQAMNRTKSLTDDDLDELKGCLDLGFGFSYEEIPELCNTLPALELCYSMSQKFLEENNEVRVRVSSSSSSSSSGSSSSESSLSSSPVPVANWKISSPGDDPDEVKARLKYWAQAVACTVKLCN
ncbi:hypothetical protein LUZ60_007575 [Juncus effusus]|nr:hypothetical protein LUZ60_007575 [Juncus effusus]